MRIDDEIPHNPDLNRDELNAEVFEPQPVFAFGWGYLALSGKKAFRDTPRFLKHLSTSMLP